jgi:hypothetical protein
MRTLLCYVLAASMTVLAFGAQSTAAKKKAPTKKTAARKSTTKKKSAPAKKTTWRNRQMAPTPERYKEIQDALVAKGYLKPEDTGGGWNQNSVEALKRFQGEQKLDPSGKINSLSLIALGLGPKREPVASPQH